MHNKQHFSEMFNFGPKHGCMHVLYYSVINEFGTDTYSFN